MRALNLLLACLFVSVFAQDAMARVNPMMLLEGSNVGRLVESKVGAEILAKVTGENVAALSLVEKRQAWQNALNKDPKLAEKVMDIFMRAERASEAEFAKILRNEFTVKNVLQSSSMKKARMAKGDAPTTKVSFGNKFRNTDAAEAALSKRSDLDAASVDSFMSTVRSLGASLGIDPLGSGAKTCMSKYSATAVNKLMALVQAWSGSAILSTRAAFDALVARTEPLYGDSVVAGRERVCILTGANGSGCSIFTNAFRAFCP